MSTKIDCVIYLKSKLESEFTKLATGKTPDIPAAQKIQSLVLTAEDISTGYWASEVFAASMAGTISSGLAIR